ncbi:CDP-diacylglycerol--glycerol-3-phosphate 3-phosphatidyltransferase [Candidatus Saccharibacteria bacterium]|nr:CDP-diacylglycerol--glycerol-3-phosphate 3-phosphatidyltransferase [Candidatus Saccharibacteria bacterium]
MESRTKKRRNLKAQSINTPTLLTLFRIILVIPTMVFIYMDTEWAKAVAIVCFIIASATDFIDGRLARKWNQVTTLGKFLDPLADKMLVNLTFLALTLLGQVPVWMFAIILVRDFAVDGLRMLAAGSGITVAASWLGKAKTMVQMITVTILISNMIIKSQAVGIVATILLYIVVVLTVASGVDYLYKGRKLVL